MNITPATVARTHPATHPLATDPGTADTRRPTRGDRLTVDPADRRRRAQTALLELVVTRSAGRRRA